MGQVLGLPLRTTMDPRTRTVDYCEVDMNLVSVAAVHQGQVTATLAGQPLQSRHHVLPVYISPGHWERAAAGRGLPQALQVLCPELRSSGPAAAPSAWLQAIPKLLNTAVVLVMDKVRPAACLPALRTPSPASAVSRGDGCVHTWHEPP